MRDFSHIRELLKSCELHLTPEKTNILNKMKTFSVFLICAALFLFICEATKASEKKDTTIIYLKDYGLYKTKKRDCIKFIYKALKDLKGDQPKKIIFPQGIYHFYPEECLSREYFESNTTDANPKSCAFLFKSVKNLIIDGRGSSLIFHGLIQPFTFDNCENIILKNIKLDWENPVIAQGQVLKVTDLFIDLGINQKEFPYHVKDGKLFFDVYGGELNQWRSAIEFDGKEKYIVPQTEDWGCLGQHWKDYRAETTMPGIVRLHHNFERKPKVGNFLVLRHAERTHSGVFILESENICIKNLDLFHTPGLGILAQFSEDLLFDGYCAIPNRLKRRYFGGGDVGLQISNCRGQISITNCEFQGIVDNPVNIHGSNVQITEIISSKEIKCKFMHHLSGGLKWGHKGDKISFIDNEKMNSIGFGNIESFHPVNKKEFRLTFSSDFSSEIKVGFTLENLTWSPNLTVKNTHFKSSPKSGLLLSTPGKVLIENNIFESSGSAILIAGDANGWFESVAVTDVLIKNNTFTELCNTNPCVFCEGIISIYPIIPELDGNTPAFHKNIRIEGNQFNPFDFPILFARSIDGLTFTNNTLTQSYKFEPYHERQYNFTFEVCKNIELLNNTFSEDLSGKTILLKWTAEQELKTDTGNFFSFEKL